MEMLRTYGRLVITPGLSPFGFTSPGEPAPVVRLSRRRTGLSHKSCQAVRRWPGDSSSCATARYVGAFRGPTAARMRPLRVSSGGSSQPWQASRSGFPRFGNARFESIRCNQGVMPASNRASQRRCLLLGGENPTRAERRLIIERKRRSRGDEGPSSARVDSRLGESPGAPERIVERPRECSGG
jgi:hypothetical protein